MTDISTADQLRAMVQRNKDRANSDHDPRSPAAFLTDIAAAGGYWGAVEDGVSETDYDLHEAVAYTWQQVVSYYQAAERALAQFETTAKAAGLDIDGMIPAADHE